MADPFNEEQLNVPNVQQQQPVEANPSDGYENQAKFFSEMSKMLQNESERQFNEKIKEEERKIERDIQKKKQKAKQFLQKKEFENEKELEKARLKLERNLEKETRKAKQEAQEKAMKDAMDAFEGDEQTALTDLLKDDSSIRSRAYNTQARKMYKASLTNKLYSEADRLEEERKTPAGFKEGFNKVIENNIDKVPESMIPNLRATKRRIESAKVPSIRQEYDSNVSQKIFTEWQSANDKQKQNVIANFQNGNIANGMSGYVNYARSLKNVLEKGKTINIGKFPVGENGELKEITITGERENGISVKTAKQDLNSLSTNGLIEASKRKLGKIKKGQRDNFVNAVIQGKGSPAYKKLDEKTRKEFDKIERLALSNNVRKEVGNNLRDIREKATNVSAEQKVQIKGIADNAINTMKNGGTVSINNGEKELNYDDITSILDRSDETWSANKKQELELAKQKQKTLHTLWGNARTQDSLLKTSKQMLKTNEDNELNNKIENAQSFKKVKDLVKTNGSKIQKERLKAAKEVNNSFNKAKDNNNLLSFYQEMGTKYISAKSDKELKREAKNISKNIDGNLTLEEYKDMYTINNINPELKKVETEKGEVKPYTTEEGYLVYNKKTINRLANRASDLKKLSEVTGQPISELGTVVESERENIREMTKNFAPKQANNLRIRLAQNLKSKDAKISNAQYRFLNDLTKEDPVITQATAISVHNNEAGANIAKGHALLNNENEIVTNTLFSEQVDKTATINTIQQSLKTVMPEGLYDSNKVERISRSVLADLAYHASRGEINRFNAEAAFGRKILEGVGDKVEPKDNEIGDTGKTPADFITRAMGGHVKEDGTRVGGIADFNGRWINLPKETSREGLRKKMNILTNEYKNMEFEDDKLAMLNGQDGVESVKAASFNNTMPSHREQVDLSKTDYPEEIKKIMEDDNSTIDTKEFANMYNNGELELISTQHDGIYYVKRKGGNYYLRNKSDGAKWKLDMRNIPKVNIKEDEENKKGWQPPSPETPTSSPETARGIM